MIFSLFFIQSIYAATLAPSGLKTGDVLLQSVPCYLCSMIEHEENSAYSHIGVVAKSKNKILVLESWQKVQALSLDEHLALRKSGTETLVLRPIRKSGKSIRFSNENFIEIFEREFDGLHYDDAFSWNNTDSLGEKLYCSEFAAKFLNRFLPIAIEPKAMHFNYNRAAWIQYFKGAPPDGAPGISPGDFEKSPLFENVGTL